MQRNMNLPRRRVLVSAVTLICGSCCATDQVQVETLTGDTAIALREGNWAASNQPQPRAPDGGVVVAGGDQGAVFAFVLGRDEADARKQLGILRARASDFQGCVPEPEGDTCCDPEAKIWLLDAEDGGKRFWLPTNERCDPIPEDWTEEYPTEEEGVDFIRVKDSVWKEMKRRGVTHPFMTLPEEDGDGRVLVDPSWKNGEFGLLPPVMDWGPEERSLIIPANYVNTPPRPSVIHAELPKRSPIILADHVNPPQPPPGYRTDRPRSCVKFINHRGASDRHKPAELHTRRHHWYKKNKSDGWWYEMPDEINYCPPQ